MLWGDTPYKNEYLKCRAEAFRIKIGPSFEPGDIGAMKKFNRVGDAQINVLWFLCNNGDCEAS